MTSELHIPDPRHPRIHDRGRGPELIGTRVTVYAVDDVARIAESEADAAEMLSLSVEDLRALTAYIADHADEVREVTLRLDERDRQNCGPLPTVEEARRRLAARQPQHS